MFRSFRIGRDLLELQSEFIDPTDDDYGDITSQYDAGYIQPSQTNMTDSRPEAVYQSEVEATGSSYNGVHADGGSSGVDVEHAEGGGGAMWIAAATVSRVIVPIVCALGVLGITLTLVVLTRKTMRTSTNCYLIALSTADLVFLLLLGTILAEQHFDVESKRLHNAVVIYGTYALIITNVALMASVWMTVSDRVFQMELFCVALKQFFSCNSIVELRLIFSGFLSTRYSV